ncbi:hypothetical protein GCM10010917_13290 [Paenibacillus physcomitrellae]|uniref:Tryptophan--tRNA ligase n=1 Tax=Paenibacillus physcomitrellae TaxID=1619311 RepID=A0ABQ1FTJ9_9BACL|nr:hypothetical protein GCM10010917_13290 [Paenibacillus physcomitrellae]
MAQQIVLTGIKPTGEVHLGNYVGAINPRFRWRRTKHANLFILSLTIMV